MMRLFLFHCTLAAAVVGLQLLPPSKPVRDGGVKAMQRMDHPRCHPEGTLGTGDSGLCPDSNHLEGKA